MAGTPEKDKRLLSQGIRTPSGRLEVVAVPGALGSSSRDGLDSIPSAACPARAVREEDNAIAKSTGAKRKRKKKGAAVTETANKGAAVVVLVSDEEDSARAESPPGFWAAKPPSRAKEEGLHPSEEASPEAITKKARSETAVEDIKISFENEEEEEDFLKPFFDRGKRARKKSLVDEPLEEVRRVLQQFKNKFDDAAQEVYDDLVQDCPSCQEGYNTLACYYNMTSRVVAMLWHREKVREEREKSLCFAMADLEEEKCALREERDSLAKQLEEERRRGPVQPGVDVATETEVKAWTKDVATSIGDLQGEMEETVPLPKVGGVDPGLLKAIDDIVVRRLHEIGGLGRKGPGNVGDSESRPPPSPLPAREESTWAKRVGGRVAKGGGKGETSANVNASTSAGPAKEKGTPSKPSKGANKRWPVPPRTAAVAITIPSGGTGRYADALAAARSAISLGDLEIPHVEVRRARTGGLILGVPGEGAAEKADLLADRLAGVVGAMGARVTRPVRRLDLRLTGVDPSVPDEETIGAIAAAGGCRREDIRLGRPRRSSPSGIAVAWVQCPMEAALRLAKEGRVKVGWARAVVELLPGRPLRCFRCLELGHTRMQCVSVVSREGRCYRCGNTGHEGRECVAAPNCPLCSDLGRVKGHVLGGAGCVERVAPPAPPAEARDDTRPP